MAPWSVVNVDSHENTPRIRYLRYAVLSLTALLVLSLGFALIPADPPAPAPPSFSEQARARALADALELRGAALRPAGAGADGGAAAAVGRVVTLLTIQARALMLPEPAATAAPTATTGTPPPPAQPAMTAPELAAALAASGAERLKDAETADGGMARLLAGAGTAQVLAAQQLAAAAGVPEVATGPVHTPPSAGPAQAAAGSAVSVAPGAGSAAACPSPAAEPAPSAAPHPGPAGADAGAALAAAAAAELEAVYGYQAALTRLPPEAAGPASEFLEQHQDLAKDAAARSLLHCSPALPPEPGYVLDADFLARPAAGLARIEAAALPAWGDVVALTDGPARGWALAALQSGAARSAHWGGDPGPVPGLPLDEEQLPPLPA